MITKNQVYIKTTLQIVVDLHTEQTYNPLLIHFHYRKDRGMGSA